ncbi:hypothetical protein ACGFIF_30350 [Kribbella sp. NPDC049174]|uniref:hypothetical protein n=1 Tax=Kribbella sp. NPDC049174 TaxID=3364112 RepID=UPI003714522F
MRLRAGLALVAAGFFGLAGTALPAGASAFAPESVSAASAALSPQAAGGAASAASRAGVQLPVADPSPAAKKLFTIRDERVTESSGLAKAYKYEGIYWTVNDSGDKARVFGVDTTGKVKMELSFNAEVRDVEAVAVDRDGTIYIADIGDNKATRDVVEIYTIPEPGQLGDAGNVPYHRYDFTYPDGAHDAETLLVEPGTDQLYIVTKSAKGAGIYAAPPAPSREGTNELTKLAPAPAGVFTDGTFLPDGQRVVLRTATGVSTIAWGESPSLVASANVPAAQCTSIALCESVAVGQANDTVVIGSEGENSAVYQVAVPAKQAATPPAASATPKPATGNESNTEPAKSHNLRWILIGAAAFALIITIITFPPGRRERLDRMAENARLTGQSPRTPHRRP